MLKNKKHIVPLVKKEQIAKDTWIFALKKPKGFTFIPGQYQSITLTISNGKTDWRDFTIASNPSEKELWIVTKISSQPSEFKKQLLQLPVGSEVSFQGPSGGFVIQNETRPLVCIAGGIGVTVFRSILTAKENTKQQITLIVSFSSKEHSIFQKEIEEITKIQKNKKAVYIFTNKTGRISKSLIQQHVPSILNNTYLIAGGQNFVDDMYELVLQMGVSKENIRIDYFTGY